MVIKFFVKKVTDLFLIKVFLLSLPQKLSYCASHCLDQVLDYLRKPSIRSFFFKKTKQKNPVDNVLYSKSLWLNLSDKL